MQKLQKKINDNGKAYQYSCWCHTASFSVNCSLSFQSFKSVTNMEFTETDDTLAIEAEDDVSGDSNEF